MNQPREALDLVDRLVSEYADRLARDEDPRREELLAQAPGMRAELERCFQMIEAGTEESLGSAVGLRSEKKLGEFRLVGEIGRGGMAVVYEAEQTSLGRSVALKVLRGHLTLDTRQVARFQQEARAAARLSHPNIVAIHAVGEEDGHHFIAFEKIDGPTLGQAIAQLKALGPRPTAADLARVTGHAPCAEAESYYEACARLMQGVFDGVQAAHEAGVIHRDLKPSNILLDEAGKPLVADFGLAKDSDDLGLSMTGEALGTPHYMSPEQAIAAGNTRIDARTDVYSLGVTLYELLALERPFEGASFSELMRNIIDQSPLPLAEKLSDLPRAVEDVVLKAMAKEPDLRYASVPELARDFARAVRGEGVEAESQVGLMALFQGLARAERSKSPFEYKSRKTLFGLPWIHVILRKSDPKTGKAPWAKGVLAFGPRAIGLYAGGGIAIGGLAFGLVSFGLLSIGVFALGVQAAGGAAVGYEAQGLVVVAVYGQALMDGTALHLMSGVRQDVEAVERFKPSGSSQASNLFFGGVIFAWTMLYAGFREKAKTKKERQKVFLMIRVLLPALYALPWALVALGHKMPFAVELAIFAAVTALVAYVLRRTLEKSARAAGRLKKA